MRALLFVALLALAVPVPAALADHCEGQFIVNELVTCPAEHLAEAAPGHAEAFAACVWNGPLPACPDTLTPLLPVEPPTPPTPPTVDEVREDVAETLDGPFGGCRDRNAYIVRCLKSVAEWALP